MSSSSGYPNNNYHPTQRQTQIPPFVTFIARQLQEAGIGTEFIPTFTDQWSMNVFKLAFTHESVDPVNNYEVLEYTGDGHLKAILSEYIVSRWPMYSKANLNQEVARRQSTSVNESSTDNTATGNGTSSTTLSMDELPTNQQQRQKQRDKKEGVYSKIRVVLEQHQTLSTFAQSRGFMHYVNGDAKAISADRNKLLEDVFEAFIGALVHVVDAKLEPGLGHYYARSYVVGILNDSPTVRNLRITYETLIDPMSRLNELLTSSRYKPIQRAGPNGAPMTIYPPKLNWIQPGKTNISNFINDRIYQAFSSDQHPTAFLSIERKTFALKTAIGDDSVTATNLELLDGTVYFNNRYRLPMLWNGSTWIRACDSVKKYRYLIPVMPDPPPTPTTMGPPQQPRVWNTAPIAHVIVWSGFEGRQREIIGQGFSSNAKVAKQTAAEQALSYMKALGYEHLPAPIYDLDDTTIDKSHKSHESHIDKPVVGMGSGGTGPVTMTNVSEQRSTTTSSNGYNNDRKRSFAEWSSTTTSSTSFNNGNNNIDAQPQQQRPKTSPPALRGALVNANSGTANNTGISANNGGGNNNSGHCVPMYHHQPQPQPMPTNIQPPAPRRHASERKSTFSMSHGRRYVVDTHRRLAPNLAINLNQK